MWDVCNLHPLHDGRKNVVVKRTHDWVPVEVSFHFCFSSTRTGLAAVYSGIAGAQLVSVEVFIDRFTRVNGKGLNVAKVLSYSRRPRCFP